MPQSVQLQRVTQALVTEQQQGVCQAGDLASVIQVIPGGLV